MDELDVRYRGIGEVVQCFRPLVPQEEVRPLQTKRYRFKVAKYRVEEVVVRETDSYSAHQYSVGSSLWFLVVQLMISSSEPKGSNMKINV